MIKYVLESFSTVGLAFGRNVFGALALGIVLLVKRIPLPSRMSEWRHIAISAVLLNALPGFLFAVGETQVTSIMAGMINATTPIMTVLIMSLAFREQPVTANQVLGISLGLLGISLLTGVWSGIQGNHWQGVLALLGATLSYGLSMPYSKRYISSLPYSATSIAAAQVISAMVLLAPFALAFGMTSAAINTRAFTSFVLLGAVATGFAYIWNFNNIKYAGGAVASTVTYVTTVVAVVLGAALLGEKVSALQLFGCALVLLSAAVVQDAVRLVKK
jgi:drug/metabolite transporter (DMT)-like permease